MHYHFCIKLWRSAVQSLVWQVCMSVRYCLFSSLFQLCVVHSVYGGFSDKALGYADKALQLINLHKEGTSFRPALGH